MSRFFIAQADCYCWGHCYSATGGYKTRPYNSEEKVYQLFIGLF